MFAKHTHTCTHEHNVYTFSTGLTEKIIMIKIIISRPLCERPVFAVDSHEEKHQSAT